MSASTSEKWSLSETASLNPKTIPVTSIHGKMSCNEALAGYIDGSILEMKHDSGSITYNRKFLGHTNAASVMEMDQDRTQLWTASPDQTIRKWNISERPIDEFKTDMPGCKKRSESETIEEALKSVEVGQVSSLSLSGDRILLAIGLSDGSIQVRMAEDDSLKMVSQLTCSSSVCSVGWSPPMKKPTHLIASCSDGSWNSWERNEEGQWRLQQIVQYNQSDESSLASKKKATICTLIDSEISPDGSLLATAHDNGDIVLWDLSDAKQLSIFNVGAQPVSVCFSPSRYWCTVLTSRQVINIDLESRHTQALYSLEDPFSAAMWRPTEELGMGKGGSSKLMKKTKKHRRNELLCMRYTQDGSGMWLGCYSGCVMRLSLILELLMDGEVE